MAGSTILKYTDYDAYLFHEGTHSFAYKLFGAHPGIMNGKTGTCFRIWAPNAKTVHLITSADGWKTEVPMETGSDGVWELFCENAGTGTAYRYVIKGCDGEIRYKSDPYAFYSEKCPSNASIVFEPGHYSWGDEVWQSEKEKRNALNRPLSIYELHPGSWKRNEPDYLNYHEIAEQLTEYISWIGYTHVELMGICEYPYDGSWGYQVSGYYAPTARYGSPDDFRYLVDRLHQAGIGVIIDWVPAHFVKDSFALSKLDGSCLYENRDPEIREFPEWGTCSFDLGKPEVRSFLISSACYWIREFHIDGLRVDAVASMLYLDYGRHTGIVNRFGDNRYLEGMEFLKQLNKTVSEETGAIMIAEDSSIEPGMTRPVRQGGYGFTYKWDMGWMNDTLAYLQKDPVYRKYHHELLTGTADYAFQEAFILVLSHDEVVHLKGSMIGKMPGNSEDRTGGLKALYTLQYMQPGKKLLFMGQEFGQDREWDETREIDWEQAEDPGHREVLLTVKELNRIYKENPVLWTEGQANCFSWINDSDADRNIAAFVRKDPEEINKRIYAVFNFSRSFYADYCFGVEEPGSYERIFSTYDTVKGGGGPEELGQIPELLTENLETDGKNYRLSYRLRPNEAVLFKKK